MLIQAWLPLACRVQSRTTCGSPIQSVFGTRVTCSLRRQSCLKEKMKKYSIDLSRKLVRKALKDQDVTNTMYPKLRPYYRTDGHVYRTRRYGLECSCLHFLHIVATMRKVDGQVSKCREMSGGQNSCQGIGASTAPGISFGSVVAQLQTAEKYYILSVNAHCCRML